MAPGQEQFSLDPEELAKHSQNENDKMAYYEKNFV
jgi:hypothetical protein